VTPRSRTTRWRLLLDGSAPGPWNMGVDEALLASAQKSGVASLRFYTWDGAWLSLGYAQRLSPQQRAACRVAGVGWVRRATGGRAVLHGADLTYSLAAPVDLLPSGLQGAYERIAEALRAALAGLGIPATRGTPSRPGGATGEFDCFAEHAAADLRLRGRKLVGSAQRRAAGALLQHGSIRLAEDAPAAVAAAFPAGEHQWATSLAGEGVSISLERLRQACCAAFEEALRARFEAAQLQPVERLLARGRALEPVGPSALSPTPRARKRTSSSSHP